MLLGDVVDDARNSPRVIGTPPPVALHGQTCRDGAVDIGELIWLDVAIGPAGTREEANVLRNLLFDIDADAATAAVLPNGCGVRSSADQSREIDRILVTAHSRTREKAGDGDLAGLAP